jgi:hypothetical protein
LTPRCQTTSPIPRSGPGARKATVTSSGLHRTILEECWRPAFARYVYLRYSGLRHELAAYLDDYNHRREHHGRITKGRVPADLVYGARKMEPR